MAKRQSATETRNGSRKAGASQGLAKDSNAPKSRAAAASAVAIIRTRRTTSEAPVSARKSAPVEAARAPAGVNIGTSGWTYADWRGPFYPLEIPKKNWLSWYATNFSTTEINGSFYRTPSLEAVRAWRLSTPPDFTFAWKASKFITHWKRLNPETCENSIALMVTRLKLLRPKTGPILFQLPAAFQADRERLARFIALLPRRYHYAFEFRHPSWYEDALLDVLRDHDISLCLSDHHHAPSPWLATAGHVYVRGHGPGGRYRDNYPDETLRQWAKHIRRWRAQGKTVHIYFDNDTKSAAPFDARRLSCLL